MKEPEAYRDREQTYLKHFVLEKYLECVAFIIGYSEPEFVYVDGFSGPWRSEDETFEDTSFMIAVRELRVVRIALANKGKRPKIRCIFVESNARAFADLEKSIEGIDDLEIQAIQGKFEDVIPEIIAAVGDSFALTFIDPTGWSGFALETISPLLERRGEVLVNFMFDFVNRFGSDERKATVKTFDSLFGGPGWEAPVHDEEEAMLAFYCDRLKDKCKFRFATHSRILKPLSDRTYFHLVYATRHPKGLEKFRAVEKQFLKKQERVRSDAKQSNRIEKSGQGEMFREADAAPTTLDGKLAEKRRIAGELLKTLLEERSPRRFQDVLPSMLEIPMVDKSAAKNIIKTLQDSGYLAIDGMKPRQRLPDDGCTLRKV